MPNTIFAQTTKLVERTTIQGQVVQTPYITHGELQSILLEHGAGSERTHSGKTPAKPSRQSNFGKLLSVSSLDEIVQLLGEPETVDRQEFSD